MAKVTAPFFTMDSNSLEANGDDVRVKVDGSTIERTASGIGVLALGIDTAQIAANAVTAAKMDLTDTFDFVGTLQYGGINVATETFVNNAIQGLDDKGSSAATTAALAACTYDNGTAGVGATLTADANGALAAVDGITLIANERVLIKDQAAGLQNGIYTVTQVGDGSNPFILTRTANNDEADEQVSAFTWIEEGTTNGDSGWHVTTDESITMGTTSIAWSQFSGAADITAGAGMTKTGNTLDVIATDTSITVGSNDLGVNVDNVTIEISSGIRVKDAGIDENKIASSALGAGLTGGSGTTISVDVANLLTGGTAEVDGDKLDIDFTPSNYTPSTSPAEADDLDNLTAHLAGIDDEIATINTAVAAVNDRRVETVTLTGTDITNGYVTLAANPAAAGRVIMGVKDAPWQHYGDDFDIVSSNRLSWSGLGLDGILASGHKVTAEYDE